MPNYTNDDLGDFMDALKPTATAWEGDITQAKADVGALWGQFLADAETYYRTGGDRPQIPPRTL